MKHDPQKHSLDLLEEKRQFRKFLLAMASILLACLTGIFFGMAVKGRDLINEQMLTRARADFESIVYARTWNAQHGGVYVEKKGGVQSNPYLINPDIVASDGRVFTKRNPALMTREISELAKKDNSFVFHITSLMPLNPGNVSDTQESAALKAFESGEKDRFWKENIDGRRWFRYMGALPVEASCLPCHAEQGYKIGDIRGGISVSFDIEDVSARLSRNLLQILGLGLLSFLCMIVPMSFFVRRLYVRLAEAKQQMLLLSTLDPLTGLLNRRQIMGHLDREIARHARKKLPLGVLLLDVDHFKRVNDIYGHQAGDNVLVRTARAVVDAVRQYDLVGRYGGEEFLVLLPEVAGDSPRLVAERIREKVEQTVSVSDGAHGMHKVTVSIGLSVSRDGAGNPQDLIEKADQAMYRAKSGGRNRVEES